MNDDTTGTIIEIRVNETSTEIPNGFTAYDVFCDGDYVGLVGTRDPGKPTADWYVIRLRYGARRPVTPFATRMDAARAAIDSLKIADLTTVDGLTPDEVNVLDFETCWPRHTWIYDGRREDAVRTLCGHSLTRHAQLIARLLSDPRKTAAALRYAPATTKQLERAQAARRATRYATNTQEIA